MIWMLCLRFPVKDWNTLPGRLSPCRSHRGQSRSVFLPRPNMLTRQRTPALWDLLQAVLGACPVFGCICSVYDCLGLQVAERRQMLDLCFSLVKCVSGEPFFLSLGHINKRAPRCHSLPHACFPSRILSLFHRVVYTQAHVRVSLDRKPAGMGGSESPCYVDRKKQITMTQLPSVWGNLDEVKNAKHTAVRVTHVWKVFLFKAVIQN